MFFNTGLIDWKSHGAVATRCSSICMGVGWGGEIRGTRSPTPAIGSQFGTKSRRMVFLSAMLLRLLRKIYEISLLLRRKRKYERL